MERKGVAHEREGERGSEREREGWEGSNTKLKMTLFCS